MFPFPAGKEGFTFLCRQQDPAFVEAFLRLGGRYAARWDEPRLQEGFVLPQRRFP